MRASRSSSPGCAARWSRFSSPRYRSISACGAPFRCGGGSRFGTRGSRGRTAVPWNTDGSHPLDQCSTPLTGRLTGSGSATNAGSSCDSEPRP